MHVALARKYRPGLFREVVGQDMFVRILRNALGQGRLGNGLLLTGIRGVGKTTLARLVAKALSCTQRDAQQEPCNVCESCRAFLQDKHIDVLEMDAASHTGVDDIRHILDGCQYSPLLGKYKIYIIDEVHMLSKSAFNALLKTLEEPPAHVKFIFATTDLPKVPLTVVSRCQQLNLNRVRSSVLVPYLGQIGQKEGFSIDPDALALLADCSEGGVRDALSLLERVVVVSSPDTPITLDQVRNILGLPRKEGLEEILSCLNRGDIPSMLSTSATLYHNGIEPLALLTQLMQLIHEKTMTHWHGGQQDQGQDQRQDKGQDKGTHTADPSIDRYDQWWQLAQKGLIELGASPFPLLALEMVLLRMAYMAKFPTPGQILSMIEPITPVKNTLRPAHPSDNPKQAHTPQNASQSPQVRPEYAPESPAPQRSIQPSGPAHSETVKSQANKPVGGPITSIDQLLSILEHQREGLLHARIREHVSWVRCDDALMVLHWDAARGLMPSTFSASLEKLIQNYTNSKIRLIWNEQAASLSQKAEEEKTSAHYRALAGAHPDVQSALSTFSDATIEDVVLL